eukprot:TRINITY_DN1699_c0_g1_i1.p1 TRINITY_DN1699_c0_g1~~TRINITY_DN1699_c0_g1_i1.p1  ORF type:complete len:373 (-),score=91.02 TRINITY_DN1699_c0_g1_i1:150-1127(-)
MTELIDFLKNTSVTTLLSEQVGDAAAPQPKDNGGDSHIITAKATDPAILTLRKMIDNRVLSVPVWDPKTSKFSSFCDILDVLYFVAQKNKGSDTNLTALEGNSAFADSTTADVANLSGDDVFVPIKGETSILEVIEMMTTGYSHLHRVPVVDTEGNVVNILSQSRLVKFLTKHIAKFDFGTLTINETNLGVHKVVSLPLSSSVKDALDAMVEHKISAVALVDDKGCLIGNFSATDLRLFGYDDGVSKLASEGHSLHDYFNGITPPADDLAYPVTVTKAATTEEALVKMNYAHVHRIYIVDQEDKPVGVIAPVDIVDLFLRNIVIG